MKGAVLVLGIVFLASSASCWAEDDVDLDKIVVTPSRIEESSADVGRTVDVVTSGEMGRSGAQNIADALTDLTSVDISNYGGPGATKNVRMRGSTSSQVLVSVDGRPVNSPRDGQVDLNNIPMDNIDRIEVVHGPGSSLYGSSAMGGIVNIITKNPPKKGQETELYSSFGTARTYVERMSQGARISKFSYLINGEYQSSQGFRPNSALSAKDCNLKLGYDPNDQNNLNLNSGFYTSKLGTPGSINYFDPDDKQNTLRRFFDFNWSFKPDNGAIFSVKAYQNYDRLEFLENNAQRSWETTNQKDIHATTVRGLDLQLNKQLTDTYRLISGFNYVKNLNDSTSTAKHEYALRAGYIENSLDLFNNKLNLNLSARIDDYSNFGTEFNPSFGALFKPNNDIKFHGLISRSFRVPTFNDLYWPDSGDGLKGNPNLKPEKGLTEEIGFDIAINKRLNSGLTYYHSNYNELIQWSSDPVTFITQPENVSSAVIDGIELRNTIFITDRLDLMLDYSYLIARDDKTHKYLVYQPKDKIDSCLKYNDHKGLTVELKSQFTSTRFDDSSNTTKVKSFFIVGVSASKKFKNGLTWFTYIDNLLNRKYQVQFGYPMPGFSITNGMKFDF